MLHVNLMDRFCVSRPAYGSLKAASQDGPALGKEDAGGLGRHHASNLSQLQGVP